MRQTGRPRVMDRSIVASSVGIARPLTRGAVVAGWLETSGAETEWQLGLQAAADGAFDRFTKSVMNRPRIGIDLGTSYSSVAWLDETCKPQPIANAEGEFATQSVVYFETDGGPPIVGRDAIEPGLCHPERL